MLLAYENSAEQAGSPDATLSPMQRWRKSLGGLLVLVVIGSGCATARHTHSAAALAGSDKNSLKVETPTGSQPNSYAAEEQPRVDLLDKLNPLFWVGNIDDPVPPAKYRPDDPLRKARWHLRNSFHNLTFYVIGIADKDFERVGRYPSRVFSPEGGWNWAVSKYKWWRLPFVSYGQGRFKFYCGWRNHGNFGMKLNLNSSDPLRPRTNIASAPPPRPAR
jgi:hypothetical protein